MKMLRATEVADGHPEQVGKETAQDGKVGDHIALRLSAGCLNDRAQQNLTHVR
jgi:hypothetical protein